MLRIRTKCLLVLMVLSGVGIGLFSRFDDGIYSAICLFLLPIWVALLAASIISDLSQPEGIKTAAVTKKPPKTQDYGFPRAA